jgi:hypothetical protein
MRQLCRLRHRPEMRPDRTGLHDPILVFNIFDQRKGQARRHTPGTNDTDYDRFGRDCLHRKYFRTLSSEQNDLKRVHQGGLLPAR